MRTLGLCMLAVAMTAVVANAATINIGAGDVDWDQDGAGTDVRIQYNTGSDAYYLNSSATPYISGLSTGVASGSNYEWFLEWSGAKFIKRTTGNQAGEIVWTVNMPSAIESLKIVNPTAAYTDGATVTNVKWYVMGSSGTWQLYHDITSIAGKSGGASLSTDGSRINDLTLYVSGGTSFSIKAVMTGGASDKAQLCRGNDLNITAALAPVPEPTTIGLVLAGIAGLLRRRVA